MRERPELFGSRQLAIQQQVGDLFECRPSGEVLYRVAAVQQPSRLPIDKADPGGGDPDASQSCILCTDHRIVIPDLVFFIRGHFPLKNTILKPSDAWKDVDIAASASMGPRSSRRDGSRLSMQRFLGMPVITWPRQWF